jgi:hypothetical protein
MSSYDGLISRQSQLEKALVGRFAPPTYLTAMLDQVRRTQEWQAKIGRVHLDMARVAAERAKVEAIGAAQLQQEHLYRATAQFTKSLSTVTRFESTMARALARQLSAHLKIDGVMKGLSDSLSYVNRIDEVARRTADILNQRQQQLLASQKAMTGSFRSITGIERVMKATMDAMKPALMLEEMRSRMLRHQSVAERWQRIAAGGEYLTDILSRADLAQAAALAEVAYVQEDAEEIPDENQIAILVQEAIAVGGGYQ